MMLKKENIKIAARAVLGIVLAALLVFLSRSIINLSHHEKPVRKLIVKEGKVKSGQSLYTILTGKFPVMDVLSIGNSLSRMYDTRKVKPGDRYKIICSTSGEFISFVYTPSPFVSYTVDKSTSGFKGSKFVPEVTKKIMAVRGKIKSSLYEGMTGAGVDAATVMNFADMFQWQVDFLTDVRPGDEFLLVFSEYFIDNKPVKRSKILVAGYKGKREKFEALRFNDGGGAAYYDFKGHSLSKQFLKAPLSYTRISSYFNLHRRHPILKYVRPHYGIDYAAPVGTPVSAVADGTVVKRGYSHDGGRYIKLRHRNHYTTFYCHLWRYAKRMTIGHRVKQGQVIAYSGSSGLSTGPHLYFRISKYNKPFNFLKLKIPSAKYISGKNRKAFKKEVAKAEQYLKYLQSEYFDGKVEAIDSYKNTDEYKNKYANNSIGKSRRS